MTSIQLRLNSIKPDFNKVSDISKKYDVTGYHVFTLETLEGATAHCRNFAPLYDIPEEAATGTSNGALSCYLYKYASDHLYGFEVGLDNDKVSADENCESVHKDYGCSDNKQSGVENNKESVNNNKGSVNNTMGSVDKQYNMKFEQGYNMDSPFEIYSKLKIRDGKIERIQVGGYVVGIEQRTR